MKWIDKGGKNVCLKRYKNIHWKIDRLVDRKNRYILTFGREKKEGIRKLPKNSYSWLFIFLGDPSFRGKVHMY